MASVDSSGKTIWAKHNEVQTVNIRVGFMKISWGQEVQADTEHWQLISHLLSSTGAHPQSQPVCAARLAGVVFGGSPSNYA